MSKNKIIIYDFEDFIIIETLFIVLIWNSSFLEVIGEKIICGIIFTLLFLLIFTKIALLNIKIIECNNVISFFLIKATKKIEWEKITKCELFYGRAMYSQPIIKLYNKNKKILKIRVKSFRKVNEIRKLVEQKGTEFKFTAPPWIVEKILNK